MRSRSIASEITRASARDEHFAARLALHPLGDVGPEQAAERRVMVRADDDHRRVALFGDAEQLAGGIAERPLDVAAGARLVEPAAGLAEERLKLDRPLRR